MPYSRKLLWGVNSLACSLVPSLPWQTCQLCRQVPHSSEREKPFDNFITLPLKCSLLLSFCFDEIHIFSLAALQNPGCDCSQGYSVPPFSLLWMQQPWSKVRTQVILALTAGRKAVSQSGDNPGAHLLKSESSHWRTSSLISHTTLPEARTASWKQPVPISSIWKLASFWKAIYF